MNDEDVALYRQAEGLTYKGQSDLAYTLFRTLRDRGNTEIEILFWIVETTPNAVEARQVLDTIKRLQPGHPLIPRMEVLHNRKLQTTYTPIAPVLHCPYCSVQAPAVIKSKVAIGGWIWFSVFFLLFLGCLFALVPIAQVPTMEKSAFFFLFVGAIGFFIRKRRYACGHCGVALGDIAR